MALRTGVLSALLWQRSLAPSLQAGFASGAVVAPKDWKAVKLPEQTAKDIPTTNGGVTFSGDLRSTSGLGRGDGCKTHTDKWLQGDAKSPIEYISEAEPIKVEGPVVASYGCKSSVHTFFNVGR
eukprot:364365-Chlamydomonas_euryale.AAC.11